MELLEDRRVLAGTGDPMDFGVIWTEDAENGLRHIIDGSDAQYPLIQSVHVFEGANAFHLAHPSPASNWLEIDRTLTIGDDTQLFFMSRLSWATPTQIARVQLSTDGGQSWPEEVYSQTGEGSGDQGFMFRQVDLSAFAGREVRIRFFYEYAGGMRYPHTDPGIGWMIDDIRVASRYETAEYSIGDPTDWEQWMLEFANRGRVDAVAESHRLAAESNQQLFVDQYAASMEDGHINRHAQPLAFNKVLLEAARLHSQDMLNNDFQSHTSSANPPEPFIPGFGPTQRAESLGYRGGVAENAFAYARSVPHSHSAFANSTGHRHNLHHSRYNEVGFAALPGTNGRVGPIVVTQKFSRSDGPLITGVVYQDLDGDAFYTPGEGRGGVRVEVEGAAFHAVSSASGGYAVPVPGDGEYRVTFSGEGFETWSTQVVVTAGENVKLDLELQALSANHPPIFTMPNPSVFVRDENDGSPWVQTNFVTGIAPGPPNAREELEHQGITFSFSEVDVPEGMMTALPTLTVNGGPGNWPGTGTLNAFPAAGAFGTAIYEVTATDDDPLDPRSTSQLLTITIDPVNDPPVAFGRTLTVREAVEADDETAVLGFTAADLIVGGPGETPGRPADLPPSVPPPFDESEQALRVVAFAVPGQPTVDAADLPGGSGTVSRSLPSGGEIRFTFAGGEFVSGSYTPPVDFNEHPIFGGPDTFTYIIEDDGKTTIPGGDGVPLFLPPQRSQPATVTLRVLPANDPPDLQAHAAVHLLEHSGDGVEVIPGWATRIAPGPPTALDESLRQSVTLDFVPELSQIPPGLFHADPQVSSQGTLTLFPAAHAVGSAEIVIRASDHEPTPEFTPRSTLASVTVHVQPVNDPPQFEPGGEVSIGADRGPYAAPWATEVLPGPPAAIDELAEQTVWFELSLPEHGHELFTADGLPTLGGDGMLRFTPAPEAQGQILIDVVAVDSLGARSEPAVLTITLAGVPGPPLVTDDRVGTYRGNALDIDLSAGAIPGAAEIDPASIEIVTPPGAGELAMLGDGRVRYVAAADASGEDRFTYRIRDIDGRISDPATVTVLIATGPLQNPLRHADVNADGEVTALDALLVINHISRYGSGGTPTTAPDDGGWYYDVSGDGVVTALDALLVINHIARGDAPGEGEGPGEGPGQGEGEGEGPEVAPTPARLATPSRFVVLGSAETDVRRSDAIFRPDDDENGLSGLAGERLASPWRLTEGRKVVEKSDPSAISGDWHDRVDWSAFAKRSADTADFLFEEYELDLLVRRG